jgi:hypothetical protein
MSPFEGFRAHPAIVRALGDPRLQAIIARVDGARNREAELISEIGANPEFADFVQALIGAMPAGVVP